jgi:hypothetical protein
MGEGSVVHAGCLAAAVDEFQWFVVGRDAKEECLEHVSPSSVWADCYWDEYFVSVK